MINSSTPIRIVLADDHEIFRDGFKVMMKKQPAIQLVAEAANGEELIEITRQHQPDVVITDIKMPKMDGIQAARKLIDELPMTKIIALSMFDEENLIVEMLETGARGYLLKNAQKEEIIEAIKTVYAGEVFHCAATSVKLAQLIAKSRYNPYRKEVLPELTDREKEVVQYICKQMTNKEIAETMNLSVRTIEGYRDRIQEKLMVKNVAGMVVYAIKYKIYQP
jgi:DNA-binding NarL/FixJ family response regulator